MTHPTLHATCRLPRACTSACAAAVLCTLLVLSQPAAGQQVSVARLEPGGTLAVWHAPEGGGPGTLDVSGLTFLPLHLAGVPLSERLRTDRPVALAGSPAEHVRLPQHGSLWLVQASGQTSVLHLAADGTPELLATRADAGGLPALHEWIAVSRDGAFALVASTPAAGGEVLLLDLLAHTSASIAQTLDVAPESLRVSTSRAFFVASGSLYASDVSVAAPAGPTPAVALDLGLPGTSVLGELALSGNGLSVAAVSQHGTGGRQVSVVGPSLQAVLVTPIAGDYDTPRYDLPLGPCLALSDDGSRVAWRGTVLATELFVRVVPQPAPAVQVTADSQFVDTIDSVGVLGFDASGRVTFLAGEAGVAKIGKADAYSATVEASGALSVQNETLTSGVSQPPFAPGALEVTGVTLAPGGADVFLLVDPDGGDFGLLRVSGDGSGATTEILPALRTAPVLSAAGDGLLVVSVPEPGVSVQLHLIPPAPAPAQLLATAPVGVVMDRFAADRTGTTAAFVASVAPGFELPVRVTLATGALELLWPTWIGVAPALTYTAGGRVALGLGGGGGPYLYATLIASQHGSVLDVPVGSGTPLDF